MCEVCAGLGGGGVTLQSAGASPSRLAPSLPCTASATRRLPLIAVTPFSLTLLKGQGQPFPPPLCKSSLFPLVALLSTLLLSFPLYPPPPLQLEQVLHSLSFLQGCVLFLHPHPPSFYPSTAASASCTPPPPPLTCSPSSCSSPSLTVFPIAFLMEILLLSFIFSSSCFLLQTSPLSSSKLSMVPPANSACFLLQALPLPTGSPCILLLALPPSSCKLSLLPPANFACFLLQAPILPTRSPCFFSWFHGALLTFLIDGLTK